MQGYAYMDLVAVRGGIYERVHMSVWCVYLNWHPSATIQGLSRFGIPPAAHLGLPSIILSRTGSSGAGDGFKNRSGVVVYAALLAMHSAGDFRFEFLRRAVRYQQLCYLYQDGAISIFDIYP